MVLEKGNINFMKEVKNLNTLVNIVEKTAPPFQALQVVHVFDILMALVRVNTHLLYNWDVL